MSDIVYRLIIDTENYAGNFEREMCAYITGQTGDCGVGMNITEAFRDIAHLEWWKANIVQVKDPDSDFDVLRPVSIWPKLGWFNNGMGGHYPDEPEIYAKAQKECYEATRQYFAPQLEKIDKRLKEKDFEAEKPSAWTEEACLREKSRLEKTVNDSKNGPLSKFPAYLSVAIFVKEPPPDDVLKEFVQRAKYFCDHQKEIKMKADGHDFSKEKIILTGFRMQKEDKITQGIPFSL